MPEHDNADGWQYHQDGRDGAVRVGCYCMAAILLGIAVVILSALVA